MPDVAVIGVAGEAVAERQAGAGFFAAASEILVGDDEADGAEPVGMIEEAAAALAAKVALAGVDLNVAGRAVDVVLDDDPPF